MIKLLHPPVLRKLNVCAYARISSDKDVNELSLDEQIEVYTNMILGNSNWNFCGIYFDDGISGASTKGRTSFNLMIEKAMLGQIDVIIVKSISRFARNTIDLLKTIQDLRNIDVEVFFENENFSSLDFKCDMLLTCYAKFADEEVISMSLNRSWRHQVDREAGRYFLPSRKLYGLRQKTTGEIYIYEPEAKWIRVIYDMYLQDKSMGEIIAVLTENKVPTYTGHGEWRATVIRSMLKNEKYVGDCLMQKTYTKNPLIHKSDNNYGERPMYYIKDGHPAYVGNGGVVGKVDDHIGFHLSQLGKGFGYSVFAVDADLAHDLFTKQTGNQLAHGAVGAEEYCSHTSIPSFRISSYSLARVASSMGVRGSRRFSSPKPMADTAALAGMGLTSLKRALTRGSRSHCIFAAVLKSPALQASVMATASLGTTLLRTEMVPAAPMAIMGTVRASSPE